uniref:Uncharacterized protein n=1 Tax=Heterosigma akashiwo TaxID=2829 RepID=A0A7S3YIE7_HETAK
MTEQEKELRRKSFTEFLVRNKAHKLNVEKKIVEIEAETRMEESFQPSVSTGSKKILARKLDNTTSFLERMEKEKLKREHNMRRRKASEGQPAECTFQPQINEYSQFLKGRSSVDMSVGDALRLETKRRLLQLRADAEKGEGLTFQPDLGASQRSNPNQSNTRSSLQLTEKPETYLDRVKREANKKKAWVESEKQKQELMNLAEHTFQPKTKDCPVYVKKIAESMAVANEVRRQQGQLDVGKPEWRFS